MYVLNLVYLVLIALLITLFFAYILNVRGPWGSLWSFFIILFLSIWAIDIWLAPAGPYWREIYWLRPVIAGLLIALLLTATAPYTYPRNRKDARRRSKRAMSGAEDNGARRR